MPWSTEDRVAALKLFFREGSVVAAQRAFQRELGRRRAPQRHTLLRWVSDFETQGTAARVPRHTPRPRVSEAIVAAVKRAIHRNPRLSIRRLAVRFGATTTTVHRILRGYLKLFPYKLQLLQRLKRGDKVKRLRFCRWALSKWRAACFRDFLLMTDEAQFHFDGSVNKQNCRVWGEENPHAFMVQDEQTPSLTVWCGVWAKGIIGPFFFEERGHGVSVTAARYCGMLEDFVVPELRRLRIARRKVWWQQDGATAHHSPRCLDQVGGALPWKAHR